MVLGIVFAIAMLFFLSTICQGIDIYWVAGSLKRVNNSINYLLEKHQWDKTIRGSENVCFDKLKLNNLRKEFVV